MKLFEYEAKEILKQYEIPIPRGELATSPDQARDVSNRLSAPFVIKAQVLVAGRGKAGGIEFAETPDDVKAVSARMLNIEIKSLKVNAVWIEERLKIKKELYFGITIDRSKRSYIAIASFAGGVNIEEVATKTPAQINKMIIDPALGFRNYHARQMAREIGYSGEAMLTLSQMFRKLFQIAMAYDAELIEMNPIVETIDGEFVAVDARLIIDDNALYRHPQYKKRLLLENKTELTATEIRAKKAGLAYVQLDGDIGIMGNGAGLVMATLDAVHLHRGKPANFFDVGGGASESQIVSALDILLSDPRTSVVLVNILGGITRCDYVAKGILKAMEKCDSKKPLVIRLVGTNEEEGRRILTETGIHVLDNMDKAAKRAVDISLGR